MKNIEIIISKTEVLEKVSLESAYTGAKTDQDDRFYDRVATIDADKELLSGFWIESCGKITDKLREFIRSSVNNELALTLNLEISNAYDEALTPSVKEDLRGVLLYGIIGRWFRFTFPERSAEWLAQSSDLLERACSKLCHRSRPVRKSVSLKSGSLNQ